jgi:Tfp pilus assembly protein PilN
MSKLLINFAAVQRSVNTWNPFWGGSLLLAGMFALGLSAWDYRLQAEQNASLQLQRDTLRQSTQQQQNHAPVPAELITQIEQANAVYAMTQTPWEAIFTALEAARGKPSGTIALLSLRADAAKRELTLTGEARDFAALNAFNAALSDIPIFQNVALSNDKLSSGNPPIVVTFDLRLTWRTTP